MFSQHQANWQRVEQKADQVRYRCTYDGGRNIVPPIDVNAIDDCSVGGSSQKNRAPWLNGSANSRLVSVCGASPGMEIDKGAGEHGQMPAPVQSCAIAARGNLAACRKQLRNSPVGE